LAEVLTLQQANLPTYQAAVGKQETCSGKSADISITPTTPGDAEQIQVRVQLRKSNADYGQPSDPAYVTVNP
jgi:hypothetical protein